MRLAHLRWHVLAASARLSFGMIPIFSALLRDHQVSTSEQVFLRTTIAGAVVLVITCHQAWKRKVNTSLLYQKRIQAGYLLQGLLLTAMIYSYLTAISLGTPAGEAALLVQVQPLFTLLLGLY